VLDLMEALKASIAKKGGGNGNGKAAEKAAAPKVERSAKRKAAGGR
jgi:non-homologous end joining protein Ku